jgi:hypothetical protein
MQIDPKALGQKIWELIEAGDLGGARQSLYQLKLLHPEYAEIAAMEEAIESWYGAQGRAGKQEAWKEWVPAPLTFLIAAGVFFLLAVGAFAMRYLGELPEGAAWTLWGFAVLAVLSGIGGGVSASMDQR